MDLGRIGADASFAGGKGVAGAIEGLVVSVVLFAEGAESLFAGPAVDGEVLAGGVGVAEQLGSLVVGRFAKELSPAALGAVGGFEGCDFFFGDFELPDNDEHR